MGYWGIDWPSWFPGGRTDYSGAMHQSVINAEAQLRSSQGSSSSEIYVGGSSGKGVQWGDKHVVIDLKNGVASIFMTRYVPEYTTKVVSRFMTRFRRVVTALTVNYMLNGQVVTQVVIPTRIVMQEESTGVPAVTVSNRRGRARSVPKSVTAKVIV